MMILGMSSKLPCCYPLHIAEPPVASQRVDKTFTHSRLQGAVYANSAALQHGNSDWPVHTSEITAVSAKALQGDLRLSCIDVL